jgi:ElaB/YqjD/DUF883 family membrane-anchored ribosome-binding protein
MATYPTNPSSGSTLGNTAGTTGTTGTTGPTRSMGSTTDYKSPMGASSGMETAETTEQSGGVTTAIGERLERAGQFLEDKGKGQFIADRLHSAGKYLQENDTRTMARSIDSAICAHPYRGILIGLGIGWVVGRFLSGKD